MNKAAPWLKRIFAGALLVGLVAQVILLLNAHGSRTVDIYKTIGQTSSWRGANFAFSQTAADFYRFLDSKLPRDATILIPAEGPEAFTRAQYVELYLYPRAVEYCEQTPAECIGLHSGGDYAILILDLKNLDNPGEYGNLLQSFNEDWGVFVPENADGVVQQPFDSLSQVLLAGLLPILLLAALTLPGILVARRTLPGEHPLMHFALGAGIGFGFHSVGLFIALWLGAELSTGLILGILLVYWIAAGIFIFRTGNGNKAHAENLDLSELIVCLLVLVPVIWVAILAVGNAYSHTDEIVLWGAKGYGIPAVGLQEGATNRGTLTTWYPLNIPLLISSFLTMFGDRLPESKLVFPLFFAGFACLLYAFFQKYTMPLVSLLGSLLIATIPTVFLMGSMAHANLPLTFYLVGGIVMIYSAERQSFTYSTQYWIWGVLFLILAAWTRPEGLHFAWATAGAIILFYYRSLMREKKKLLWLLGGLSLYSVFWSFAAPSTYLQPGYSDGIFSLALNQILNGNLHFGEAVFIFRSLAEDLFLFTDWGVMGLLLVLLTLCALWKNKGNDSDFTLLGFGLVILIAVWGAFIANSYTSFELLDIGRWVNTTLMRLALPGLVLVWISLFIQVSKTYFAIPEKKRN